MTNHSRMLREVFDAAVGAVKGDAATRTALQGNTLADVYLVAVGKAASSMAVGALSVLDDTIIKGLVLTKYDHTDARLSSDPRFVCRESAHPVPDENSLTSGALLKEFIEAVPESAQLLFLTSGGASALVEALPESMSLSDLQRVNEYLLGTGMTINEMNHVRRSLSTIKGGRLAGLIRAHRTTHLMISDVPGDQMSAIGSGLLIPPDDSQSDRLHEAESSVGDSAGLPDWLAAMMNTVPAPELDDPVWKTIDSRIIASNAHAGSAAVEKARELGLTICLADGNLDGDVADTAGRIVSAVSSPEASSGLYVWGGETTVVLPANPGRGGRNQQLALLLASKLAGVADWQALCCGTDGTDGPTDDAGGLVTGNTSALIEAAGLSIDQALEQADAGTCLEAADALVRTGPTGTNVMDLALVLKLD